jgi:choice-of-anchor B domain-containing protein
MKKLLFTLLIALSLMLSFQNIFAQGKNVSLVGKLNPRGLNTGINYSALWGYSANGREYAILGGSQLIYFIDVTDSTNIRVCSAQNTVFSDWHEMKTYSHYAYCVSEGGMGIQIFDLAGLPNSVKYLGEYHPGGMQTTHSIQIEGPYLYLNGGSYDGIKIVDLSVNPEQPVDRGLWDDYYVHDCRVRNDTIWAANIDDGKISVINAANKNNPVTITNWTNGPNPFPHNVALTPGRNFIFTTDETLTPPGRLKVWNIQNLSDVLLVNTWYPGEIFKNGVIHNVELYGTQLHAAYYSVGLKILDVSTPGNPVELGWYDTYPESNANEYQGCWGVYKFPSGKIILSDRTRGLFVVRYTPPVNAAPKAEFMYEKTTKYFWGDSVQFIDCSTNNPTSYQWTITGGQTLTSTSANPKLKISSIGDYLVKLKVTNAFGSDSIVKTNLRINGSILTPPVFSAPLTQTIITNKFDTSKIKFKWSNASPGGQFITYKFRVRKFGQLTDTYYISNNNGNDSSITFTSGKLDSIAAGLGFSEDSVLVSFRTTAYNGLDSVSSGNVLLVTLRSTSVGIQNISTQIPDKFKLENNFPNPFNPSTNIKFQLAEKSFASIIVYDMLGREVMTLLAEELNAGYYNYQFNAENLNSGIYFYTLRTEKFTETKKMALVK